MATAQAARKTFARRLRVAIDDRNVSIRSVARTLNPESPETARSNLMRWLRGAHRPSRTSRRAVAAALGLPADYFESDDDDEESDPVADLITAIRVIMRDEARTLVRDELEKVA